MSDNQSNEEVLDSILTNFVPVSEALSDLLSKLITVIVNKPQDKELEDISSEILSGLINLLPKLDEMSSAIPDTVENIDIYTIHDKAISNIFTGAKQLVEWLKAKNVENEKLELAINKLFEGSQNIVELVNALTE